MNEREREREICKNVFLYALINMFLMQFNIPATERHTQLIQFKGIRHN